MLIKSSKRVLKASTPGARVLGRMLPYRGVGWPGGWGSDRLEQVLHFRNWNYVSVHTICSKIGQLVPNMAYVHHQQIPGRTRKYGETIFDYGSNNFVSFSGTVTPTVGFAYRKSLSGVKPHEDLEPIEYDHPLRRLLENPNEVDTTYDLLYELQLFLELCGVSYLWMVPNGYGVPCELWVVPAHWVWPRTAAGDSWNPAEKVGKAAGGLIDHYEVRPWGGTGASGMLKFPAREVLAFQMKSPLNKLDGWSPQTAGAQWIDTEESIVRSRWSQMINQARADVHITLPEDVVDPDDDRLARIEAKFMAKYQGETNYGKPIFTPSGTKVTPLSFSPQEMAYFQSEEQMRDMVLALRNVPKTAVGISNDMTFGSVLATMAGFCTVTINPRLVPIGQRLTKELAPRFADPGQAIRVWYDDVSPADPQQINSDIAQDLQAYAITPNEVRALRGRPAYKHGGDDPMVSGPGGIVPLPLNTGESQVELGELVPAYPKDDAGEGAGVGGALPAPGPESAGGDQGGGSLTHSPDLSEPSGGPPEPPSLPSPGKVFAKDLSREKGIIVSVPCPKGGTRIEVPQPDRGFVVDCRACGGKVEVPSMPPVRRRPPTPPPVKQLDRIDMDEEIKSGTVAPSTGWKWPTLQDAGKWVADKWRALEGRYGRAGALAVVVSSIATFPIPFNITAIVGAAEGIRRLTGKGYGKQALAIFKETRGGKYKMVVKKVTTKGTGFVVWVNASLEGGKTLSGYAPLNDYAQPLAQDLQHAREFPSQRDASQYLGMWEQGRSRLGDKVRSVSGSRVLPAEFAGWADSGPRVTLKEVTKALEPGQSEYKMVRQKGSFYRPGSLADLAFVVGSGRLNLEVEEALFKLFKVEDMYSLAPAVRNAADDKIKRALELIDRKQPGILPRGWDNYKKGPTPVVSKALEPGQAEYKFCSTQFDVPAGEYANVGNVVKQLQEMIDPEDLAGPGLEKDLHITVRYGLHDDDPAKVAELVKGFGPVGVKLGCITCFPAENVSAQRGGGGEYDVIKMTVEGDRLRELNALLGSLPCTDKYPTYTPHLTIAYVKPGLGQKYANGCALPFKPDWADMSFGYLTFSSKDGTKTPIPLDGPTAKRRRRKK